MCLSLDNDIAKLIPHPQFYIYSRKSKLEGYQVREYQGRILN